MNYFPKYDGNIHPDKWIDDIQKYYSLWPNETGIGILNVAKLFVDTSIELPTEINDLEKLRDALKKDITFTIFKNTNKRKLQSLKYIPERKGGDTSKFISTFRKLCYNAEINDVGEQKEYLFKSLPSEHFDYISNGFYKRMKNVNSINELTKEFEEIVLEESSLIRNNSVVALKHIATGKYLSSIKGLNYTTGSGIQLVFVSSEPDPNSLWNIRFGKELVTYADSISITLRHVKSSMFLGINERYKSPSTDHTEVSCGGGNYNWRFKHSKLDNHQGYLKSNDIINLSLKKSYDYNGNYLDGQVVFLRCHDIQFTIGNDTFQEVICHNGRLGGHDEWCIELIHEVKIP